MNGLRVKSAITNYVKSIIINEIGNRAVDDNVIEKVTNHLSKRFNLTKKKMLKYITWILDIDGPPVQDTRFGTQFKTGTTNSLHSELVRNDIIDVVKSCVLSHLTSNEDGMGRSLCIHCRMTLLCLRKFSQYLLIGIYIKKWLL
jgi:hypothetical protein